MATYAIGDVQGCYAELRRLIDTLRFDDRHDHLVFVGDLVNRGPGSLEVLRFVRGLADRARTVLGNHDLHLLTVAAGFSKLRPDDTLDAVLRAPDRDALLDWLCRQPLALRLDPFNGAEHMVVHAGLLPSWSVDQALALAGEVHAALSGPEYLEFFANMYGSRPDQWRDSLGGYDRLRVIVNAMTRMRFCSAQGRMEFQTKGEAAQAPPGFMPWFDVPARSSATHTIVCGHWSALGLQVRPRLLALDTGCVWGGALTALRLDDRAVFQVPAGGRSPGR